MSGAPSTLWTLTRGGDLLASTRAAGSVLAGAVAPPWRQLGVGAALHAVLSLGWGVVLALVLPARRPAMWGAGAGLAIGALDLGVSRRRHPLVRRLALGPQLADHLVFGGVVGAVIGSRRG